jgi:hypothetical protein
MEIARIKIDPGIDLKWKKHKVIDIQGMIIGAPYGYPLIDCIQGRVVDISSGNQRVRAEFRGHTERCC